jgi:hypothetical protein
MTSTNSDGPHLAAGSLSNLGPEDRALLAKAVCRLFDLWGLDVASQSALLGFSPDSDAVVGFREGAALPDDLVLMERVSHLLAIHERLRLMFPHNRELVYRWPNVPNRAFDNRSPVEIMIKQGVSGMVAVRGYLDAH